MTLILSLDQMIFIHELNTYRLEMYLQTKNELSTSGLSKVIVLHTQRHACMQISRTALPRRLAGGNNNTHWRFWIQQLFTVLNRNTSSFVCDFFDALSCRLHTIRSLVPWRPGLRWSLRRTESVLHVLCQYVPRCNTSLRQTMLTS